MSLPTHFPLKVADGKTIQIPSVGYGTWAAGDTSWCKDAVLTALKAGYRHLDCAWMYGVDKEIGLAIRESGIPRSEIFITTKFWPQFARPENIELCLDHSLRAMGLEYVDLLLAHWPVAFKPISRDALEKATTGPGVTETQKGIATDENGKPLVDWEFTSTNLAEQAGHKGNFLPTWTAMQRLVATGKTRSVGLSNFSISDLRPLLPSTQSPTSVPISCNQIEVHPWLPQTALLDFCKSNAILVTCYSPFAGQKSDGKTLLQDETVRKVAERNGMDVGQLLQSWAVQRGTVPLGKSQTEERIQSNLAVRKLAEEDMEALNGLEVANEEGRTVGGKGQWGVNMFSN